MVDFGTNKNKERNNEGLVEATEVFHQVKDVVKITRVNHLIFGQEEVASKQQLIIFSVPCLATVITGIFSWAVNISDPDRIDDDI